MLNFKLGTHNNPKFSAKDACTFSSLEKAVSDYYYKANLNNLITVFTQESADFGLVCFDCDVPFYSDIAVWIRSHYHMENGHSIGFPTVSRGGNMHLYFRVSPSLHKEITQTRFNGLIRDNTGKIYSFGDKKCEFKAFTYGIRGSQIADSLGFEPSEVGANEYTYFINQFLCGLRIGDSQVLNLMKWFYPIPKNTNDANIPVTSQYIEASMDFTVIERQLQIDLNNLESSQDSSAYIRFVASFIAYRLPLNIRNGQNIQYFLKKLIPVHLEGKYSNNIHRQKHGYNKKFINDAAQYGLSQSGVITKYSDIFITKARKLACGGK